MPAGMGGFEEMLSRAEWFDNRDRRGMPSLQDTGVVGSNVVLEAVADWR